jgi:acetoacetyl-CoA synthetase
MISSLCWQPDAKRIHKSQMMAFYLGLSKQHPELTLDSDLQQRYQCFHRWSLDHPDWFWQALWHYTEVIHSETYQQVIALSDDRQRTTTSKSMNDIKAFNEVKWFNGARLNFAENLLRFKDDRSAIVSYLENGQREELSFRDVNEQVDRLSHALTNAGLKCGDRVCAIMPNTSETVIAMLACTRLGAIWSSCSPDFGAQGILDRFEQIEAKFLFCCDGYRYNHKHFDIIDKLTDVIAALPSLEHIILSPVLKRYEIDLPTGIKTNRPLHSWDDFININETLPSPDYQQLPFDHPLFILFSSGTTGKPKCIVHSAGGTLLQHLKELKLHTDITDKDVVFYYSSCGWMMWNWLVSTLACGATIVLYDGAAMLSHPLDSAKTDHYGAGCKGPYTPLFDIAEEENITVFGTSAKYLQSLEQACITPKCTHDLSALRSLLSTGSPLAPESFDFVYRHIKSDLCLSSICGGTDIVSCFMLGNPWLPVYRGQLQCKGLGMAVEFWNENGVSVDDEKAELVCTQAFPSCPLGFWNDAGERFHKAYFERFNTTAPVWSQGDFGEVVSDSGGLIIYGRSDTVLNPGGVRIGTAEIYRHLIPLEFIEDSVIIGQAWKHDIRLVLFVVMKNRIELSEQHKNIIKETLRTNASPRHVPSIILPVSDIPRTISGKIAEQAVKSCIEGQTVSNLAALANPDSLLCFEQYKQSLLQ